MERKSYGRCLTIKYFYRKDARYVLGSSKNPVLEVHVSNRGEDAYGTKTYVKIPQGLLFNKFLISYNGAPDDVTPLCITAMNNKPPPAGEKEQSDPDEKEEEENEENKQTNDLVKEIIIQRTKFFFHFV